MTERLSHKDQDIAPTYQADYVTQDILILDQSPPWTWVLVFSFLKVNCLSVLSASALHRVPSLSLLDISHN